MGKNLQIHIPGFRFSAVKSGIRGKDRLDLGLISCDKEATAAALFTKNRVKAAPVLLGMERLQNGRIQAVMVNAGIANACTGEEGMVNARTAAHMVAKGLDVPEDSVLVSSTGVIGQQLDMACFEKGIPNLVAGLDEQNAGLFAQAIMTTDTVPKVSHRTCLVDGVPVTVAGIAKGAGMIMPNMATMLAFLLTDANVSKDLLKDILKRAVDRSFNRITVDGDSSTNDTVLALASSLAENNLLTDQNSSGALAFEQCLSEVCLDLALQIVADGEGAGKLVTIKVTGASSEQEADMAARTIANSPLVKTAFFGQDANWGRIIGALGRSGADFDPNQVDIFFDHVLLVREGLACGVEAEESAAHVLQKDKFMVTIDLKNGRSSGVIYTCDFSLGYVKINADYRS